MLILRFGVDFTGPARNSTPRRALFPNQLLRVSEGRCLRAEVPKRLLGERLTSYAENRDLCDIIGASLGEGDAIAL